MSSRRKNMRVVRWRKEKCVYIIGRCFQFNFFLISCSSVLYQVAQHVGWELFSEPVNWSVQRYSRIKFTNNKQNWTEWKSYHIETKSSMERIANWLVSIQNYEQLTSVHQRDYWRAVWEEVSIVSCPRKADECEDKIRNMISYYKKVDSNNRTGEAAKFPKYYEEFDSILRSRDLSKSLN